MRFELTAEQADFARSLERRLAGADPVAAARAWAAGDHEPGLTLWRRLADQGVHALVVPEHAGGMGASAVELVTAFEAIGRHVLPGPWIESVVYLPRALDDVATLSALAEGAVGTVAVPPVVPLLLDADVADHVYVDDGSGPEPTAVGAVRSSVDRTRHLFEIEARVGSSAREFPAESAHLHARGESQPALDTAVLATAAELLGAGERLLDDTVAHVKQRRQFGREIGSYQAIKHRLADVRIALDFARPLVLGAALTDGTDTFPRDVSAAKVACGDAAYLASRTALQLHGAIGYTREFDLSLWITRVRALCSAWGTAAWHRDRVLAALVEAR